MPASDLTLSAPLALVPGSAGLLVSRGVGRHPARVWPSFDLIFVRSGVLGIHEEDQPFSVLAGESLLLWPDRRHGGIASYPPDLSFYWVHFDLPDSAPDGEPSEPLVVPQHTAVARPDHMTALCRRYLDDQEGGALDTLTASLLIQLMLCEIARTRAPGIGVQNSSAILAQRANAFILTHFHEPISIASLAVDLGCNPNYLSRVYRQVYGHTATEAIHRRRLEHARHLLLDSLANIDEIARESGFSDAGYFRRLFKRHQGMTPLAYRRLYARVHVITE